MIKKDFYFLYLIKNFTQNNILDNDNQNFGSSKNFLYISNFFLGSLIA